LNYAVVFGKVEVLGGDDVDTKSSSIKSSSSKVKTTKQRATESESEPDLPSNSVKHLFNNITLIRSGKQPTPSKLSKGITHKKDKQDVGDEMVFDNLLDNKEVIHVLTTPTKQGVVNLKRVKLGMIASSPLVAKLRPPSNRLLRPSPSLTFPQILSSVFLTT
jgi:hypothetical protein